MERFDIFNARQNGDTEPTESVEPTTASKTNGHAKSRSRSASETGQKREAEDSESSSDVVDDAPPKKKRKENKDTAKETDAEIAARLQAQEDRAARPTRGAAPRKAAPAKKKKTPKKKTATRITGSDDSDVEEGGTERKVNRETGFHKPMNLSSQAADFFGVSQVGYYAALIQQRQSLICFDSCLDHRLRSRYGHTSKTNNYKIKAINDTFFATTNSGHCSSKTRCTCFR